MGKFHETLKSFLFDIVLPINDTISDLIFASILFQQYQVYSNFDTIGISEIKITGVDEIASLFFKATIAGFIASGYGLLSLASHFLVIYKKYRSTDSKGLSTFERFRLCMVQSSPANSKDWHYWLKFSALFIEDGLIVFLFIYTAQYLSAFTGFAIFNLLTSIVSWYITLYLYLNAFNEKSVKAITDKSIQKSSVLDEEIQKEEEVKNEVNHRISPWLIRSVGILGLIGVVSGLSWLTVNISTLCTGSPSSIVVLDPESGLFSQTLECGKNYFGGVYFFTQLKDEFSFVPTNIKSSYLIFTTNTGARNLFIGSSPNTPVSSLEIARNVSLSPQQIMLIQNEGLSRVVFGNRDPNSIPSGLMMNTDKYVSIVIDGSVHGLNLVEFNFEEVNLDGNLTLTSVNDISLFDKFKLVRNLIVKKTQLEKAFFDKLASVKGMIEFEENGNLEEVSFGDGSQAISFDSDGRIFLLNNPQLVNITFNSEFSNLGFQTIKIQSCSNVKNVFLKNNPNTEWLFIDIDSLTCNVHYTKPDTSVDVFDCSCFGRNPTVSCP